MLQTRSQLLCPRQNPCKSAPSGARPVLLTSKRANRLAGRFMAVCEGATVKCRASTPFRNADSSGNFGEGALVRNYPVIQNGVV